MSFILIFSSLFIFLSRGQDSTSDSKNKFKTLCEDPVIDAADRLKNETYRVYRGSHYWELRGIPPKEKSAQVKGPFHLPYPSMLTFKKKMFVFTVIGGEKDGYTYQVWQSETPGTCDYNIWGSDHTITAKNTILFCENLDTGYNDGDLENKTFPTLIELSGDKVHYTNTSIHNFFTYESDKIHGGRREKFPSNLTTAFPIPSKDPKVAYYLYLFRGDKYCFRPIYPPNGTSDKEYCPEWRHNSQLFGCLPPTFGPTTASPSTWIWFGIIVLMVFIVIICVIILLVVYERQNKKLSTGEAKNTINSSNTISTKNV